jgi:hypothetical protein
MRLKGVCYDVGRVMGIDWRPSFDPKVVHMELGIIKDDLHCNAVRICGLDINRLMTTAEDALEQGLEVWLSPERWNKSEQETIEYITKAATAAETLRRRLPDKPLIFSVGTESTLFMKGILEGGNISERMGNPKNRSSVKLGEHNKPLNAFLARASESVRKVFQGQITYASLPWETVDWSLFDFVGVDHYRIEKTRDNYVELLKPLFTSNKPVVISEFGFRTYRGAEGTSEGMDEDIVDNRSLFLHQVSFLGRFVQPRLRGDFVRDEGLQARELVDQLITLDGAGVEGAFVMTFVSPIFPFDEDPRHDLDMASYSLVKTLSNKMHGETYPDMTWEPKESFRVLADYYGKH